MSYEPPEAACACVNSYCARLMELKAPANGVRVVSRRKKPVDSLPESIADGPRNTRRTVAGLGGRPGLLVTCRDEIKVKHEIISLARRLEELTSSSSHRILLSRLPFRRFEAYL